MAFLWWGKKKQVKNISAPDMARYATQSLRKSGRNQTAYRLIYHALVMNPYEPEAIIRLSEFFDDGRAQRKPDPQNFLAGLVLDYALDAESSVPFDQRQNLQKVRLKLLWAWGYAKANASKGPAGKKIEEDAGPFDIDEEAFLNAISNAAAPYRSFYNAFVAAHTIIGVRAGLVVGDVSRSTAQPWEIIRANFKPAKAYPEWLNSDAEYLQRLDAS